MPANPVLTYPVQGRWGKEAENGFLPKAQIVKRGVLLYAEGSSRGSYRRSSHERTA